MAKVTIYTTPTCPYCNMAKEYFSSNKIDYNEIDVSADHGKAQEMIKKTGQTGVPVIEIGDQAIVGFDQQKVEELIKEKGE